MRPLLAVALVAATASAASADTYLGLGIGTSASPSGDMQGVTSDGNRTGRLMVGTRFGHLAIEGAGSRFGFFRGSAPYQGTMLAAAVKYGVPLGDNFEVFGRGGLQRTWLSTDTMGIADWAGNGWLLGAGFEYRLNLGATAASLFVDYERTQTTLDNQAGRNVTMSEGIGLWTLGATVSL